MRTLTLALLACVLAGVCGGLFGAGNSFQKRYPGSRPISYAEYQNNLREYYAKRRTSTARPQTNFPHQRLPNYRPLSFPAPQTPSRGRRPIYFPATMAEVALRPIFYGERSNEISALDASLEFDD